MRKILLVLLLANIALSGVCGLSGYLYRDVGDESNTRPVEDENGNKIDNCELNIESDEKLDADHQVFSGNGYKYAVGCRVNDVHSNHGDKYYVIDLVVYGPNKRVSKAWHEQYQVSEGRHISMSKEISFYWLGYSSIICSVSKYNKATNKFTKICQSNDKVFVKENPIFSQTSTTKQMLTRRKQAQVVNNKSQHQQIFTPNDMDLVPNTTMDHNYTHMSTDAFDLTPSNVRAMQYRDLYKANSKLDSQSFKAKRALIEPIVLALVFLFIFCVAIGTIAYLTYSQRLTQAYQSVSRNAKDNNQLAMDEISLERYNKRPKSYAVSESNEGGAVCQDTNKNSGVIYKGNVEQTARLIEQP